MTYISTQESTTPEITPDISDDIFVSNILEEDTKRLGEEQEKLGPRTTQMEVYLLEFRAYRNLTRPEISRLLLIYATNNTVENTDNSARRLSMLAKGILISHSFQFINFKVSEYLSQHHGCHDELKSSMIECSIFAINEYFHNINLQHDKFSYFGYISKVIRTACINAWKESFIMRLPDNKLNSYMKISKLFPTAYLISEVNVAEVSKYFNINQEKAEQIIKDWFAVLTIITGQMHVSDSDEPLRRESEYNTPTINFLSELFQRRIPLNTPEEEIIEKETFMNKLFEIYAIIMEETSFKQFQVLCIRYLTDPLDYYTNLINIGIPEKSLYLYINDRNQPLTFKHIAIILGNGRVATTNLHNRACAKLKENETLQKLVREVGFL